MPLDISSTAIAEKNKLASTGVWIMLIEVTTPISFTVLRFSSDTDDTTWDGELWQRFPFEIDQVGESSKGEVPKVICRVSNATRAVQSQIETEQGGVGSTVRILVVHSDNLSETTPEIELTFECTGAECDEEWVHFTLGVPNPFKKRYPRNRVINTFCNHKFFKGTRCQYTGGETTCDRTLTRCRELNNSINFGGFPGVGRKGIYL